MARRRKGSSGKQGVLQIDRHMLEKFQIYLYETRLRLRVSGKKGDK